MLRIRYFAAIGIFLALAAPTWQCGSSEEIYDESDLTPAQRCAKDCDMIYACGYALPDDLTGAPLSLAACRAGCDDAPGNVDCLDDCRESYTFNETCTDVEPCVSDACGIPLTTPGF